MIARTGVVTKHGAHSPLRLLGLVWLTARLIPALIAAAPLHSLASERDAEARSVRSVILIIGDGMDDHQITLARNYLMGPEGRLALDGMSVRSAVQVLTVSEDDPSKRVYVADSANSASSMATGIVTSRGRIATTAKSDEDVPTILELAHSAGLKTGIVTTSSLTDATAAAFMAHIKLRDCENPEKMKDIRYRGILVGDCSEDLKSAGGRGSISEQIVHSGVDLALGGGREHFEPSIEGGSHSVADEASRLGFQVVTDPAALNAAPRDRRLLGLFAEAELPVMLRGEQGRRAEKPDPSLLNSLHWYFGSVEMPEPMACEPNPDFAGVPRLETMSEVALDRLSTDATRGFFLMIESASIDKQAHARNPCGSIGELQQLDETLKIAVAFASSHPGTLILVTADHGQAAQIIPEESLFAVFGAPVFTPGQLVRLEMPDGSIMAVNYATNSFMLEEHTGVDVPLFANDEGRGSIPAMLTQPEIFSLMRQHLGL